MGSLSQFEEYADPLLRGHLNAGNGVGGIGFLKAVEDADYFLHNLNFTRKTQPGATAWALPRIPSPSPPAHACHGSQEIAGHLRRRPRRLDNSLHPINVSGTERCEENCSSYCSTGENTPKVLNFDSLEAIEKKLAGTTGLEPATSDVTGRRSNQLNYVPALPDRRSSE